MPSQPIFVISGLRLTHCFQLHRRNLLDRTNCRYETQLKLLTRGKGAQICVNCVRDMRHVTAMLNCAEMFGEYIDMTDRRYDDEEWKIGSFVRQNSMPIYTYQCVLYRLIPNVSIPTFYLLTTNRVSSNIMNTVPFVPFIYERNR